MLFHPGSSTVRFGETAVRNYRCGRTELSAERAPSWSVVSHARWSDRRRTWKPRCTVLLPTPCPEERAWLCTRSLPYITASASWFGTLSTSEVNIHTVLWTVVNGSIVKITSSLTLFNVFVFFLSFSQFKVKKSTSVMEALKGTNWVHTIMIILQTCVLEVLSYIFTIKSYFVWHVFF